MVAQIKILGINDDSDACECCGRTGLKRVVWLERLDSDGMPMSCGVNCAATLLKISATRVQSIAESKDAARADAERNTVHDVGDVRSVRPWVVESVSSNGDCSTLCFANGLRPAVVAWADQMFPTRSVNVRISR